MFWQKVHQFDQHLTLVVNSWNSSVSDPIWVFFSDKLVWIPMYAGIIALLFWKLGWKKALVVIAAVLMTFGFCDQFSNLIKHAVCRIRPLNDEFMVANGLHILEWGGGYGFFSAHAANALGLAFSSFIGLNTLTTLVDKGIRDLDFLLGSNGGHQPYLCRKALYRRRTRRLHGRRSGRNSIRTACKIYNKTIPIDNNRNYSG